MSRQLLPEEHGQQRRTERAPEYQQGHNCGIQTSLQLRCRPAELPELYCGYEERRGSLAI
jgi:hypothetical protein